jgi:HEAT repeat protein
MGDMDKSSLSECVGRTLTNSGGSNPSSFERRLKSNWKNEHRMKLDFRQMAPLFAGTIALALVSLTPYARSLGTGPLDADDLVLQLRGLPAELYIGPTSHLCNPAPSPCSPPPPPPAEIKRQRIYSQLSTLGSAGVPALARGLQNVDASVRSNSALALYVLSDESLRSDHVTPGIDIRAALPALIVALDSDSRTGALAAQAIGNIGAPGVAAVPALVKLLSSKDEGLRNGACIGLGGIGPSARSALPQLNRALADPSNNVRGFARLAIAKIDGRLPP